MENVKTEQTKFISFEHAQKVKVLANVLIHNTEELKKLGYVVTDYDLCEYPLKTYFELKNKSGLKFWTWV